MLESRVFWLCLSCTLAVITLAIPEGRSLWLVSTMIASANFGAKCVRAELRDHQ